MIMDIDMLATPLKLKQRIFGALSDYVWITCNIVGDTYVGESSMPLLTPTPLKMVTGSITSREYVPVVNNRFQMLHIQMITNLKTLEPYDGPNNVLLVLHFKAKHKRSRFKEEKGKAKRLRSNEDPDRNG